MGSASAHRLMPGHLQDAARSARFEAEFDGAVFLASLRAAYPAFGTGVGDSAPPPDLLALYLSRAEFSCLDASPGFDEAWYRSAYPDVQAAVERGETPSGLYHYVAYGRDEGRSPRPVTLPEPQVEAASEGTLQRIEAEFDADWYAATYLGDRTSAGQSSQSAFRHYVDAGMLAGNSPNAAFCEAWYVAFHMDVREAIAAGDLLCGFHHYVVSGRIEGRAPSYDMAAALEGRMPGVTQPVLLERSRALASRLLPTDGRVVADRPRTLWVVLPRLNPDISFGGYRACFELIAALRLWGAAQGLTLEILVLEEERANVDYFLWRTGEPRLKAAFTGIRVRGRAEIGELAIGPRDRFLAYSSWDVIFAAPLAALTDEPRVIALVQEYEPIFHEYGSVRAISEWALELPTYPIFNSAVLRDFFFNERAGVFKTKAWPSERRDYAVFEHVIHRLPSQGADQMRARSGRTLALYARPEGHACRNLYELAELALMTLCAKGRFDARWRFVGLGSLTPVPPVDLGGGHCLTFAPKMAEEAYRTFVRDLDLGVSLMYAPHPSVIPFEFATTGALVVTNTFSNRRPEWFARLSSNILACEPTLPALVAALEAALDRVEAYDERVAGTLIPTVSDWPQVFDTAFLDATVGRLL